MKIYFRKKKINIKKEHLFLIFMLLCIFSLRFFNTGELSGGDDSEYAELAMHIIEKPSRAIYPSFPDEPMSYGDMKYNRPFAATPIVPFIFLFGYTNTAVKMPSIIFAMLSALVLFYLLKRQFNAKIAYLATILFTFLPFHIAFTRIGLLHSAITFYVLLTIFLVIKGIDERKPTFFYMAAMIAVVNLLTTDFRGVLPLLCLIPYLLLKKKYFEYIKEYKHLFFAGILAVVVYFGYMLLPFLWNEPAYFEWFKSIFIHSLGLEENYSNYFSFSQNMMVMGKYLVMTPFIGLIFVPMIFGVGYSIKSMIKNVKRSEYVLWTCYLLVSLLYYVNKQPYVERQVLFSPAYVTLAALGIYLCYISFIRKKRIGFLLMTGITAVHYLLILKITPILFNENIKGIVGNVISIIDKYFYFLIGVVIIITVAIWMIIKAKNLKEDYLEGIAGIIIVIFILINIITATFLVAYGMGIFKRPDANMIIGEYMKENIDNEKYGCVAYNQDKSFTFYTQHICANYKKINVSWLEEQKANNDLKFFVINLYQRNVGIGMETWADIEKYFPEEYAWVMENTVDITENTGLDEDNPYFKLYELKKE